MNLKLLKPVLMPIFIGVAILVIASAIISGPISFITFNQDTLSTTVPNPCTTNYVFNSEFEPYYASASVSPIEEPWNTYTAAYQYCYLNGLAGSVSRDIYGRVSCSFSEFPYDEGGYDCYGILDFTITPRTPDDDGTYPDDSDDSGNDTDSRTFLDKIIDSISSLILYILKAVGLI